MTILLIKLILTPVLATFAAFIFPGIFYSSYWQPIVIGVAIALVTRYVERILLRSHTKIITLIIDFFTAFFLTYILPYGFENAYVLFPGAVFTAILFTVAELPQHYFLLKEDVEQKSIV
ncbi:DUF2512 family protein [Priestia endophytica]|jgi:hypothetical protein|uniref:DUF2512 family protein n=1 Tax=Priestia endophytica TaxID=135735 RepID=UPI000DCA8F9A|nr:DUF2512 family protein [Priestia endophytica]RAS78888.1 hypothetical protein A4R27_15685 [Priestia endophytica]